MKHYFNLNVKIMWAHIKAQIFALVLGPIVFYIFLSSKMGWYVMSSAMGIMYAIMLYSEAYRIAQKDIKSYSEHKAYAAKGVLISIMTIFLTFIFTLFYNYSFLHEFADYDTQMKVSLIARALFKGWNFVFEGFRSGADNNVTLFYWILIYAFMPLFSFLGYLAGMNRYEFGYKFFSGLVYKKDKR